MSNHLLVCAASAAAVLVAAGVLGNRWWTTSRVPKLPAIRQLTFRRGNVQTARFADERTVVYGAAWDGQPSEVFTLRTDSTSSTPIGLKGADVLGVSSKGELAVLIRKKHLFTPDGTGTLARVPIAGGTPRELLEDVIRADWAPNGEDLAVCHMVGGKLRLEYPIGTALCDCASSTTLRVSPNGNLVAFTDNESIVTVDRKGTRKLVSSGWSGVQSGWSGLFLAWSPRGDEILVLGGRGSDERALYSLSLAGNARVLMSNALHMQLHDVAPDGRLLVEVGDFHAEISYLPKNEERQHELGWLFGSSLDAISEDGTFILFDDPNGVNLRKTDGTPAVVLAKAGEMDLSSDGRWILSPLEGPPRQLAMIPIGPGERKRIPIEGLEPIYARFLPNNKGFVIRADGKDGKPLMAVIGPNGGKPRVVATDPLRRFSGFDIAADFVISPGGDRILYVSEDHRLRIVSLAGAPTVIVSGELLDEADIPVRFSADGGSVLVQRHGEIPGRIDRIDLATGRREPWKRLMPDDPTAINHVGQFCMTPDGQSYAYNYSRGFVDDLYLLEGVR